LAATGGGSASAGSWRAFVSHVEVEEIKFWFDQAAADLAIHK
jgi:hypothetical protein